MTDAEPIQQTDLAEPNPRECPEAPGECAVPAWGIVLLGLYLLVGTVACLVAITQMWPHPTPSGERPKDQPNAQSSWEAPAPEFLQARCRNDADCRRCEEAAHAMRKHLRLADTANDPECVRIFGIDAMMWNERRLLFIVVLAGAIGGFLYSLRSFFWYVGNRKLVCSWIPLYLVAPFTSSLLAVITYLVIRGGFFSAGSTIGDTSPYAFAALAGLVGMFHRETSEKLRQIFETIFTKAESGKNSAENPKPVLKEVVAVPSPMSRVAPTLLTLHGDDFMAESVVNVDGKPVKNRTQRVNEKQLRVTVDKTEVTGAGATVLITVTNPAPGGGTSDGVSVPVEPA